MAFARQVERERRRVEQGVEREQGQEQGVIALAADCAEGVAVGDVRDARDAEGDVQESRVALQSSTHHAEFRRGRVHNTDFCGAGLRRLGPQMPK